MTAATTVLARALASDVRLSLDNGDLRYSGPTSAIEALKPILSQHKAEIINHLRRSAESVDDPPVGFAKGELESLGGEAVFVEACRLAWRRS